jgi:flavin reductase (DIM6/NTAB) family NADH-FMN oxidoreductase RutF
MGLQINSVIQKIFFKNRKTKAFYISRLKGGEIEEQVFLKKGKHMIDVSATHAMICLDPFCMAVWLSNDKNQDAFESADIQFKKGDKLNASLAVSLIEKIPTPNGGLLLYKIINVKNYQLTALHRLAFFAYSLRSKTNTYYSRRAISALYSYPRSIIIVSYRDEQYCNIFPMDIHGYIEQEGIYLLGLRTTNVTLDKIIAAKKVVVADTSNVAIDVVYTLGKQASAAPTPIEQLPFKTFNSEVFGFPVPDFTSGYKEIELISHKKMGYHMLLVGKVVNKKSMNENSASLYHVGFLQFQNSSYNSIDGVF